MKAALQARARALGFDACRVTSAAPPDAARYFEQWLQAGHHGKMAYLARNAAKRTDPQQVLPGARSLICLAVTYAGESGPVQRPSHEPSQCGAGVAPASSASVSLAEPSSGGTPPEPAAGDGCATGFVARYARSMDYHDVLGDRLQQLTAWLNHLGGPNTRSLWYVDTGPVLERDLAQRAGLGFIGKHTNLISRSLGNWFFIAEILTTLELEPDAAEKNRCGSCQRCLAACPTQAFVAPFQLDARRCISYLTIELKDPIPVELRPLIGHRIFGCDDCLAVCPWNRFARMGRLMQEHRRADLEAPALIELLALDEAAFRQRFVGTPIFRTRRRGLLRNVCVALGNCGDAAALPALEHAAADAEPLIAEHARWAVERIQQRMHGRLD